MFPSRFVLLAEQILRFSSEKMLFALFFLRNYATVLVTATLLGCSPDTYSKWAKIMVQRLAKLNRNRVSCMKLCNCNLFLLLTYCF